jgi:hypothetical protein
MDELNEVAAEVDQMIGSFTNDPADSDHQRGYLSALREVKRIIQEIQERYE